MSIPVQKSDWHNSEAYAKIGVEVMKKHRSGEITDLTPMLSPAVQNGAPARVDRYEGKHVVDNSSERRLDITALDGPRGSAGWARGLQSRGAAIHAFCYEETGFLFDAAKRYAALNDNETFLLRTIDDSAFVHSTLHFFTGGNYTHDDSQALRKQVTVIVEELAQQIKGGEEPDLSKLQNTLTIGGIDVSITELMEYQKVGRELTDSFQYGSLRAPLSGGCVAGHAKMGLAKSIAELHGSDKGELGRRFSDGMARLYDKALARQVKNASSDFWKEGFWSREALDIQVDSAKSFGNMDSGSKESITKDFSQKLNRLESRIRAYCYTFGNSCWYDPNGSCVDLNGTVKDIQDFFQSWIERIG